MVIVQTAPAAKEAQMADSEAVHSLPVLKRLSFSALGFNIPKPV